jgi:cell division protein FtsW
MCLGELHIQQLHNTNIVKLMPKVTKDNQIAAVIVLLMAIGVVFVFSASANVSYDLDLRMSYNYPGLRQILFFPLACFFIFAFSCVDYRRFSFAGGLLRSSTIYLLILSIILLIAIFWLGTEINQALRWYRIKLGSLTISFQPSELAKWSLIFFLAAAFAKFDSDIRLYWKRFLPICCVIGLVVGLIVVEDFGTAAFLAILSFLMLVIAGARWWHLSSLSAVGVTGFATMLYYSPSRLKRIIAFIDREKWADSVGYQAKQSLIALGSGGLWGKGLGRGICKYGHLPEDTSDFIFAIIGEELGFAGTAAVIGLFIVFILLGILVVRRCQDRFGQLLAAGIVLAIAGQAALNIAVVTVLLPTKGIPLPFISAGGTSLLLSSAAIGVLLNIAKQSTIQSTT